MLRIETSNHRDVSRIYYSICKVDDSLESLNPSWPTIYGKIWELRINVYDAHTYQTPSFSFRICMTQKIWQSVALSAFFCCHCISSVKSIEMHWRVIQCTAHYCLIHATTHKVENWQKNSAFYYYRKILLKARNSHQQLGPPFND